MKVRCGKYSRYNNTLQNVNLVHFLCELSISVNWKCFALFTSGDGSTETFFDTNFNSNEPNGLKQCENSYGNYTTLKDALEECEQDYYCQMVYNEKCDDDGTFTLCNKLEGLETLTERSCIYKKSKKFNDSRRV